MTVSLAELAALVGGTVVRGDADLVFCGMASLADAGPGDISFLGNEKYHPQFLKTRAGAVLVAPGVSDGPESVALVAVGNPSLGFAAVVERFTPPKPVFLAGVHLRAIVAEDASVDPGEVRVHAGAVIGSGTSIGAGSEIGANAVIGERVKIGRNCLIHPNVVIRENCVLGDRVILQPGAIIGSDGFGYEFSNGRHVKIDQVGYVEIHDDVEIGANTTVDRARFGKTIIGEGTKIDNQVQVGHNVILGKHVIVIAHTGLAGSCSLGDYVVAAAQVGVAGHVHIGDKAVLGGRTGANRDLPGGVTYMGNPAQSMMDEQRQRAVIRKLPEMAKELREMKKKLGEVG